RGGGLRRPPARRAALVAAPEVRALPRARGGGRLLLRLRRLRDLQPAEPAGRREGPEPGKGAATPQGRGVGSGARRRQGEVPPGRPQLAPSRRGGPLRL